MTIGMTTCPTWVSAPMSPTTVSPIDLSQVPREQQAASWRTPVAANRHPGQVGYSHSPPQEVRDEESSLRADPGKEGEGQAAHAAACAAHQRQRQPDLPVFRSIAGALLHLERAL